MRALTCIQDEQFGGEKQNKGPRACLFAYVPTLVHYPSGSMLGSSISRQPCALCVAFSLSARLSAPAAVAVVVVVLCNPICSSSIFFSLLSCFCSILSYPSHGQKPRPLEIDRVTN